MMPERRPRRHCTAASKAGEIQLLRNNEQLLFYNKPKAFKPTASARNLTDDFVLDDYLSSNEEEMQQQYS